eukprot:gene3159-5475_t
MVFVCSKHQYGVISNPEKYASFVTFTIKTRMYCLPILQRLAKQTLQYQQNVVLSIGESLKDKCYDGKEINFPTMFKYPNHKVFPHTGGDFFLHIKAKTTDERFDISFAFTNLVKKQFGEMEITETPAFAYKVGQNGLARDLGGFEDGTDNLKPDVRKEHVLTETGGSFMIAQKWVHDLKKWNKFSVKDQESMIGRTKKDSIELDPMPPCSHVGKVDSRMKMYRQSLSFGDSKENGLLFIAYANQMRAFHHALNFMSGSHNPGVDKIIGNLSNAVSGAYWYVPSIMELKKYADPMFAKSK